MHMKDSSAKSSILDRIAHVLFVASAVTLIGSMTGIALARAIDQSRSPEKVNALLLETRDVRLIESAVQQAMTSPARAPQVAVPEVSVQGANGGELLRTSQTSLVTVTRAPRVVWMEVTAYCPCTKCCGPEAKGITASGMPVSYNDGKFVAADTKLLPFGTRLQVPGYHDVPVEVMDRGGAIRGYKLDVYFASHEEALEWGRRWVQVKVLP